LFAQNLLQNRLFHHGTDAIILDGEVAASEDLPARPLGCIAPKSWSAEGSRAQKQGAAGATHEVQVARPTTKVD